MPRCKAAANLPCCATKGLHGLTGVCTRIIAFIGGLSKQLRQGQKIDMSNEKRLYGHKALPMPCMAGLIHAVLQLYNKLVVCAAHVGMCAVLYGLTFQSGHHSIFE